jgi:hypothetical protein
MTELRMISAEGDEGFEGVQEQKVIGLVIGMHGNFSRRTAQVAAKLWSKAIRQCPQSRFELALMPDGVDPSDDAARRHVRVFAKLTGLDQPQTARRWLSSQGQNFLRAFGVDLGRKADDECQQQQQDCLHCFLWPIIKRYCHEHPDGCVDDVMLGLADVIADYLNNKNARPLQDKLWQQTKERMVTRMRDGRKQRHHE